MYIILDVETGGIDPVEQSLLTGYLQLLDDGLNQISDFTFALKNNTYRVSATSLDINKINLIEHDKVAESKGAIAVRLYNWLENNLKSKELAIPIGHNVNFDLKFMKENFPYCPQSVSLKKWEDYIHYRTLDTQVVARFLQMAGFISKDNKCSLRDLARELNIKDTAAHTADGDVAVTLSVLKHLLQTIDLRKTYV